jgi:transposase
MLSPIIGAPSGPPDGIAPTAATPRSSRPRRTNQSDTQKPAHSLEFLAFCDQTRARYPAHVRLAFVLDNFSVHKGDEMRAWAADNNVELAYTPQYASWLNRIEPQFKGLRYFCLAGTDHPDHETQAQLIADYINWRNQHRDDPKLRHLTRREFARKATKTVTNLNTANVA